MQKQVRNALPWIVTIVAVIVLFTAAQTQAASFTVHYGSHGSARHYTPSRHSYAPSYHARPSYYHRPPVRYHSTYSPYRYQHTAPRSYYHTPRTHGYRTYSSYPRSYRPSHGVSYRTSTVGRVVRLLP